MFADMKKANMSIFHALHPEDIFIPEPISPPHRPRLRAVIRWIGWLIVLGIGSAMALAFAVPFRPRSTDPALQWLIGAAFVLRVFRFHLGMAVMAVAGIAMVMRGWKLGLAGLVIGAALLWPTLLSVEPRTPPPSQGTPLRVMTMNLLYLNRDTNAILRQIRENNPDIIAMQEYSKVIDPTVQAALAAYPYRFTAPISNSSQGMAIYSRVPIKAELQRSHNVMGVTSRIRAEFEWDGKKIVLYDVHPTCPNGMRQIVRNQMQAVDLIDQLATEKNPVIVAGDFNATETTASAVALKRSGLSDSHEVAGFGHTTTWPNKGWLRFLPGFQIDHVYFSSALMCRRCWVAGGTGSDHWPVVADLGVRGNE